MDQNVQAVIDKHTQRAEAGLKKYGVTTERGDLTLLQWLQHAQDEAMDLAIYLERLMFDLRAHSALGLLDYKGPSRSLSIPANLSSTRPDGHEKWPKSHISS